MTVPLYSCCNGTDDKKLNGRPIRKTLLSYYGLGIVGNVDLTSLNEQRVTGKLEAKWGQYDDMLVLLQEG